MKKSTLFIFFIHLICNGVIAQSKKNNPDSYTDPSENFYITQKRMNAFFKGTEKELRKELAKKTKPGQLFKEEEERETEYEIYKRWELNMEPRVYPSGDKTQASRAYEEYQKYIQQKTIQKKFTTTSNTWIPFGPFGNPSGVLDPVDNGTGRVNTIRFDPSNSNGLWACTADGGLWKSSDNGTNWTTNTDNLSVIGCADVVFDPTNSQIMYFATGDAEGYDAFSIGVLKSTDGGNTWVTTGLAWPVSDGKRICKLLINPLNKNEIFAATNVGLYRTLDAGVTWNAVIGSSTGTIFDIEYRPGDTTTVYCVSKNVHLSTDGGATFSIITSGLPASTALIRLAIGVTAADPNYVYVVAASASNYGFYGLYQSINSGVSFTQKSTSPNILGNNITGTSVGGQAFYDLCIASSPSNASEVIVGGVNLWKSLDGGATWAVFTHWSGTGNPPYAHTDFHDLLYKNATTIYAANDGGVIYSADGGTTFNQINGTMNLTQIYRMGLSASTYSAAIIGTQDNGTSIYTNGTWTTLFGGDAFGSFIDKTNDLTIYTEFNGRPIRSYDGGVTGSFITSGLPTSGNYVSAFHQDPIQPNTLYSGSQQMYKSTNQGTNWAQIGSIPGTSNIPEFVVSPSNPLYIYAIKGGYLSGNALYKTMDGGTTWTNITGTLPVANALMTRVTVEDDDPNSIWVTFSGYANNDKVYMSTNGGTTWVNYSTGLPNLPMNCIVYQNGTKDALYVGGDVGVYYRDSLSNAWTIYNTGLPNVELRDLKIFYPASKLRAATFGRGAWEIDLNPAASVGIHNSVVSDDLFKLYPNPNNGAFVIEIPSEADLYTLEIYNALNQLVFSDKIKSSGTASQKTVSLPINCSKGVYTVSMWSNKRKSVQKIMID